MLSSGVGCKVESLLELGYGLGLGSRIFVEGLAQVAVLPQLVVDRPVGIGRGQNQNRKNRYDANQHALWHVAPQQKGSISCRESAKTQLWDNG